jgi:imidazolonepropionase-like amidohydrolase
MRLAKPMSFILLLAAVVSAGGAHAPHASLVAVTDVTVIDGTGAPPRPHLTVIIDNDRIADIAPADSQQLPQTSSEIDGSGRFLIPGLWDMHAHVSVAGDLALPLLLANGVTGVREPGGDLELVDWWLGRIERDELAGPRLFRAGPYVDGHKPGIPYRLVVDTASDGRRVVGYLKQRGVDFIKVHTAVPSAAYFALLEEARRTGVQVVGHIPVDVDPLAAIEAGHGSVEHVVALFEGPVRRQVMAGKNETEAIAEITSDENIATLGRLMAARGTWFDPTLIAYDVRTRYLNVPMTGDPRFQYVSASLRAYWQQVEPLSDTPARRSRLAQGWQHFLHIAGILRQQNVRFLVGTDLAAVNVVPGFAVHDELRLLVEIGFTPLEAITIATRNSADSLGQLANFGTIETGKRADLVLLDADPLADIANTQRIHAVVADGHVYRRADLDALLKGVAARAKQR